MTHKTINRTARRNTTRPVDTSTITPSVCKYDKGNRRATRPTTAPPQLIAHTTFDQTGRVIATSHYVQARTAPVGHLQQVMLVDTPEARTPPPAPRSKPVVRQNARTVQASGVLKGVAQDRATVVSVRLDPRDMVLLDLVAAKRDMTRSDAMRDIVLQWLSDTYDKAII